MAIMKPVLTPFGAVAQYNKIVKAEIDARTQVVEVMVAIYMSAEARDLDAPPIWHEYVRIPFAKFTQDPRNLLYPLLGLYTESYLRGGASDGESTSGNYTITLTDEALGLTVPSEVEVADSAEPESEPLPLPPAPQAPAPDQGIPALALDGNQEVA